MMNLAGALNSNIVVKNDQESLAKSSRAPTSKVPSGSSEIQQKNFSEELDDKFAAVEIKEKDIPQNTEQIQPLTREAVMEVFLDRMENELGVSAETVLAAFAKLPASDMMSPPEESAEAVIAQLGLGQKESEKALDLYNEMLSMTAVAGLAQHLAHQGQGAELQIMNKQEANLQELRASLSDMSDRFFLNGAHSPTGVDRQAKIAKAYAVQMEMNAAGANRDAGVNDLNGQFDISAGAVAQMNPSSQMGGAIRTDLPVKNLNPASGGADLNLASGRNLNLNSGEALNMDLDSVANSGSGFDISQMTSVESDAALEAVPEGEIPKTSASVFSSLQKAVAQPAHSPNVIPNPLVTDSGVALELSGTAVESGGFGADGSAVAAAPVESMTPQTPLAPTLAPAALRSADGEGENSEQDHNGEFGDKNLGANPHRENAQQKVGVGGSFVIESPKTTSADVQNNVKEIISQAQYLAGKGGGEMKVALNPEGLGEVTLKVKIANGQVNVEMITSHDEAKKVLEKGLSDLKDSLAVHKLHLDSIRIENSKEISHHLDQQQKEFEQGHQQKFLNDFRERNNGYKREMYEFGGAVVPASQTRERIGSALYDPSKKKRSNESRRLDLVA